MLAKAAGYRRAPTEEDTIDLVPLTPAGRSKQQQEPMDRFRRYEEEFLNCSRNISRLSRQLEATNGVVDAVISVSVDIDSELAEAEGYLRAMDVEFRAMVGSEKKSASQKVADYRDEYRQMIQSFQNTKQKAESEALKSGPAARTKLVTANQRLDQSTATLESSRMIIAQTEDVGNTIMTDLEGQKETLQGAQSKVQETRQFTLDAKSVLRMMGRRAVMHNLCMMLIIFILFGVICIIIYYGFIEDDKK
mmetsp:Transcript_11046/g.16837  ORF Transcript_11046/g.16837 Transcript_11046/m.16837 type:complete len:249 (+) Transcript_11046:68-814(+)